ncbi:hypothetical protein [Intestinibacter sp.]
MNKGYIGVTDNDWAEFVINNKLNLVNFWRKKNAFKAINPGDIFFFLKKNNSVEKKQKLERKIIGYGIFKEFRVTSVEEAWQDYEKGNGCENIHLFHKKINEMYNLENDEIKIGSIILEDINIFDYPVYLSKIGIDFANSIVSGKTITIEEVNRILEAVDLEVEYTEYDINMDNVELEEGENIVRIINTRKRNQQARALKFKQFLKQHGDIYCEVCREQDIVTLDVHHDKIQVSEMEACNKTKLSDLRVICSNCHRKVHGHKITVDELIQMYSKNEKIQNKVIDNKLVKAY